MVGVGGGGDPTVPVDPGDPGTTGNLVRTDVANTMSEGVATVYLDRYGTLPAITLRTSSGSLGSPGGVAPFQTLGAYSFNGWGDASFGDLGPGLNATATEMWTDTRRGAFVSIFTVPDGTNACREAVRFTSDGDLSVVNGAALATQTFTLTDDVTGNQGMPLHIQVNDTVNYPNERVTAGDGHTTSGSPIISSVSAAFKASDAGRGIKGTGIPDFARIGSVSPLSNQATLTLNATATNTNTAFTIGGGAYGGVLQNFAGGPKTYTTFKGATFDGVNTYPAVMQGPNGYIQIDGVTEHRYDANGIPVAPFFQTAATFKNGPRITSADVNLTNGSATVTSATAAFVARDAGAVFQADVAGVPAGTTLAYVNATTATMSNNFTGTTTTTAVGQIWQKLNIGGAALINNSPSWVADTVETGMTYQFTVTAPGIQFPYGNPPGIYGFADDQYFGAINGGWLNLSAGTHASAANGGYISGGANISTVTDFFLPSYVGYTLTSSKSGIPANTTIITVTDSKNAVLSANATVTQTGAVLTADPDGTDMSSIGFWSLPVWYGKVNMGARYDIYLSEAYMAPDVTTGVMPILDKHVGLYVQSQRLATTNWSICVNSPIVGYELDSVYTSAMFKDAGTSTFGGAFLALQNDYTLDFANPSIGSIVQFSGTVQYRRDGSLFGAGTIIQDIGIYKNARRSTAADGHTVNSGTTTQQKTITSATAKFSAGDVGATITGTGISGGTTIASVTNATTAVMSAVATATNTNTVFTITANITLSSVYGMSVQKTIQADGVPLAIGSNYDFYSEPSYTVANSGTMTVGLTSHVGYESHFIINAGASLFSRVGLHVKDATGTGTVGSGGTALLNQFGIYIEALSSATTLNYGLYNLSPTYLGGMTVSDAGIVGGTHNLFTLDGTMNTVTGGFGVFGVKFASNFLPASLTIDKTRISTSGPVLQGDLMGDISFRGAGDTSGTMLNVAMLRGVIEQDASVASGHSGGRVEIITTPLNSTTLALAAIVDNAKSFHLAPTLDGTSQLVNASGFAVKADGSVWVAPSTYSAGGQPTAAAATISAAGIATFSGAVLTGFASNTASRTDVSETAAQAWSTTASMTHRIFDYFATETWSVAPSAFGMFIGFNNRSIFQNDPAATVNLTPIASFVAQYTKRVDTATGRAFSVDTDFVSGPTYSAVNSGTFTSATHQSFIAGPVLNATGSTMTLHQGFTSGFTATAGTLTTLNHIIINDATGAGTVTTQIGIDIAALAKGGTLNTGIRNASTTVFTPTSGQALVAATTISPSATMIQVTSSASITLSATPTITAGTNGQLLVIVNNNTTAARNITFQSEATAAGTNLSLAAGTIVVGPRGSLTFMYSTTLTRWVQIGQNIGNN